MSKHDLLVIAEHRAGEMSGATGSAVAFAHRVRELVQGRLTLLVAGSNLGSAADAATRLGVDRLLLVDAPELGDAALETLVPTVVAAARTHALTIATATSFGKDLLPRIAAHLEAGFISECEDVTLQDDALVFRRAVYAGNAWEYCRFEAPNGVVSVRQSSFRPMRREGSPAALVEAFPFVTPNMAHRRIQALEFAPTQSSRPELADARVIVSGGRMLRERFFPLLEPLADELGAAIGATRAACDGGFAPASLQIGQTGKVVAPDLYVAIGISGATQHIAGIRNAGVIVAIDRDPLAPIFEIADYGLVADFEAAIPELTAALARRRAERA